MLSPMMCGLLREGSQSSGSLWVAQGLSSTPMFVCSLPGAGRGEESSAEADVSPPALLPQPLPPPLPTPVSLPHLPAPAPAPSVVPSPFQPLGQPTVQPELLPPKPVPVYSDTVRNLPDEGPEEPLCTHVQQCRMSSLPVVY